MIIIKPIDKQKNVIGGSILPGLGIPGLPTKRNKKAKYTIFGKQVETWNKDGLRSLAVFLLLTTDIDQENISIESIDLQEQSFTIKDKKEAEIKVKLLNTGAENDHPMVIIKIGNLTKKYICESTEEGLIIDLISITLEDDLKKVTRDYSEQDFKTTISGWGFSSVITISGDSNEDGKFILPNEETLIKTLLTRNGLNDVKDIFSVLFHYEAEEMSERKTEIHVYGEIEEKTELIQSIQVFRNLLLKYTALDILNPKDEFTYEFNGEEYVPKLVRKTPNNSDFFQLEQAEINQFIAHLNEHTNNRINKE